MGKVRCVSYRRQICIPAVLALMTAVPLQRPVFAATKTAPQLSGNLETQNIIRHPNLGKYQFVQNRNTVRLRVDWDWFQKGKLIDKIDIPLIERSKLFVLYRGVYDGFYDIRPGDRQLGQTRYDDLVGGSIGDLPDEKLSDVKFENSLREAYVDLKLKGLPVSFRLGRQQVIWGESDQFRLMDIWNPLDVTWHFQHEQSWDNIRIPLWLGKALWDIGEFHGLSNVFAEVVYNPFDFQPGAKIAFLPLPWSAPFPDPLRHGQVSNSKPPSGGLIAPNFNLQGTSLMRGDFERNPQDASEVGTRLHAVTPQGLELSAAYLYGRGRGVGAASPFGVKIEALQFRSDPFSLAPIGQYQRDINNPSSVSSVTPIDVIAKVVHPYMHIFGLTGNYFEGDYTQTVFRFESAYAMGEPFQTTEESERVPVTVMTNRGPRPAPGFGRSPLGLVKKDVWSGMIGFDRPTWIRFLNSKATWFLSGQIFWNYTLGHRNDHLVGNAGAGEEPYFGPLGKWVSVDPAVARQYQSEVRVGQIERQQNSLLAGNGDQFRTWEHLITFAGTSFYRAGTIVPFVANAWDPVNSNNLVLWYVDYFFSNDLIITLHQKFFMQYGSKAPSNDPWWVGGRFHRRDETGVKLTYQF